jgi:SET domain-containing protein
MLKRATTTTTTNNNNSLDDRWALDATVRGGLARFINHSCAPNCFTEVMQAGPGAPRRIGIFAARDIMPGEELVYDYKV